MGRSHSPEVLDSGRGADVEVTTGARHPARSVAAGPERPRRGRPPRSGPGPHGKPEPHQRADHPVDDSRITSVPPCRHGPAMWRPARAADTRPRGEFVRRVDLAAPCSTRYYEPVSAGRDRSPADGT